MLYRTLGRTNLSLSILGFGASPLGNAFETIDPAEGKRAVHHAIEQGINYFDTSPYYGLTLSESRLGEALQGRRQRVVLASKTGRFGATLPDGFDFSAARVQSSVEESLRRLRTDYLDVLLAHDIEFCDKRQIFNETIPALHKLKESGKVRFIGVSGYPLHLLSEVASTCDLDLILSYCRYNLLDTSLDHQLRPLAQASRLGLISASPLHMRVLTQAGAPGWHPAPKRVVNAAKRAAEFCHSRGADIAQLALHFALQYTPAVSTLVGMSSVAEVDANLQAMDNTPDTELLTAVQEILRPVQNIAWHEGRPENYEPGAVPKQS